MLRLPLFCLVPTLLAAVPLATAAQAPVDSVVRTTTVTTVTTTTITKPAAPGSKPTATTSSSSTTTTATAPAASSAPTPVPPTAPAATRQPGPGDLVGVRPTTTVAKPAATATAKPKTVPAASASRATAAPARPAQTAPRAAADPTLTHLLQTDVDLARVRADELPNLYERFLETTRAERRQWTSAQWEGASAALARLNQRYQQLRADISLEDKLNIRTLQGEFRTPEAAKQVSKRL